MFYATTLSHAKLLVSTELFQIGLYASYNCSTNYLLKYFPNTDWANNGHLSRGISWHALKACRLIGSCSSVATLTIFATVRQRDSERLPKAVRYRCHSKASTPDGPWLPLVLRVALRMACASILSNIQGWYGSVFGQSCTIKNHFI